MLEIGWLVKVVVQTLMELVNSLENALVFDKKVVVMDNKVVLYEIEVVCYENTLILAIQL